jgi:transcriptional regulator with XRE-family HTH domain
VIIDTIRTPQGVGQTIRSLRRSKKMTGLELAGRVGLSQSKVSKIETGDTRPTSRELENILNILNCPKTIRQQIAAVYELNAELPSSKYRPILDKPDAVFKREQAAAHLRYCVFGVIPALLQTAAYREALLSHWKLSPKELVQKMQETMKRQDLLWDRKHTFHFIMHETALYTTPGSREVQFAQLDRIERLCGARNIKIGILPLEAGLLTAVTSTAFVLYDNRLIIQELAHREHMSDDPEDIAEHIRLFSELDKKACYKAEATNLIHKAMQFLA